MIAFLLTPLGRYGAIIMLVIALCMYGIHSIKEGAIAQMELQATQETIRRTNEAISAGDHANVAPGRLRDHDTNERD